MFAVTRRRARRLLHRGFGRNVGRPAHWRDSEQNAAAYRDGKVENKRCTADVRVFDMGHARWRDHAQQFYASECRHSAHSR